MADQCDDHTVDLRKASMLQTFRQIAIMVQQQLNTVLDHQKEVNEDDEELMGTNTASINIKDLANDFATDEFVSKNVRVRPTSSHSKDGHRADSEGPQRTSTLAVTGQADEDDERKYNAAQLLEINFIRNEQKERLRLEDERKQREAELQEKKRAKRQ